MESLNRIVRNGLNAVTRRPKLWTAMYIFLLALAAVLAAPFTYIFSSALQGTNAPEILLRQFDLPLLTSVYRDYLKPLQLRNQLIGAIALAMMINIFISGGLIALFNNDKPLNLKTFLADCRSYLGRFLRLAVLALPYYLTAGVLFFLMITVSSGFTETSQSEFLPATLFALVLTAFGAMLMVVGVLFDYTRIMVVRYDYGRMLDAVRRTIEFVRQNFGVLVMLSIISWLIAGVLIIGYRVLAGIFPADSGAHVLIVFLLGQLLIFVRTGVRLVYLSVSVEYFRHRNTALPGLNRDMPDAAEKEYGQLSGNAGAD